MGLKLSLVLVMVLVMVSVLVRVLVFAMGLKLSLVLVMVLVMVSALAWVVAESQLAAESHVQLDEQVESVSAVVKLLFQTRTEQGANPQAEHVANQARAELQ